MEKSSIIILISSFSAILAFALGLDKLYNNFLSISAMSRVTFFIEITEAIAIAYLWILIKKEAKSIRKEFTPMSEIEEIKKMLAVKLDNTCTIQRNALDLITKRVDDVHRLLSTIISNKK